MQGRELRGAVLRIEKGSIHDGDGLRTVVFLKGCPFHCAWCAAPESQDSGFDSDFGIMMNVAEVVAEIAKDEVFYYHSGGGVTISGGEPLLQPEFCEAVLSECKKMGINTAMETAASGSYEVLEKLLPYLDAVYADIKVMNDREHIKWTGFSNETVLSNIKTMSRNYSGKLRIRIPLVPTVNIDDNFIQAAAGFCKSLAALDFVEFLPYHRLGLETYRKLRRENILANVMPPSKEEMEKAKAVFRGAAPNINVI